MLALIIAIPTIAMASVYNTNITLAPGGVVSTPSNQFTKGSFSVVYDVDSVFDDSYARYAQFALTQNQLFGKKELAYALGKTDFHTNVTLKFGNQSAGKYHYQIAARANAFDTGGPDQTYSGFIGRLTMKS